MLTNFLDLFHVTSKTDCVDENGNRYTVMEACIIDKSYQSLDKIENVKFIFNNCYAHGYCIDKIMENKIMENKKGAFNIKCIIPISPAKFIVDKDNEMLAKIQRVNEAAKKNDSLRDKYFKAIQKELADIIK
ncbi:MAG: hypothetical protein RR420_01320 [Anaerovoracaceae bacterium]